MSTFKLPGSNYPFLNVKLRSNDLCIDNLLSQVVSMNILLVTFISVHSQQIKLLLCNREVNKFNDLSQVRIADKPLLFTKNFENVH